MSESNEVASGLVHAGYHAFWLRNRRSPTSSSPPFTTDNGLVYEVEPGSIVIFTGISSGDVLVTVDPRTKPFRAEELDRRWEEAAEISIESVDNDLLITSLFAHMPSELPSLATTGPGMYRLLVCARGRDSAVDLAQSGVEEYLFVCWPAKQRELGKSHRHTDNYGTSRRNLRPG